MTTLNDTQTRDVALVAPAASTVASGVRSGALLAIGSAGSIFLNYVFLLAAGRILGSDRYGSLAALLGLLAVVLIPAGALQMAVSREISRLSAAGRTAEADAFGRAVVRRSALATLPLVALALALAYPLAHVLHIKSTGVVALAEFAFATALVYPAAMGVLQGHQRFRALAFLYVAPFVVRLVLLALLASLGFRLGGAVFATVAASFAATAIALALSGEAIGRTARHGGPELRAFLRYLGPVAIGLVGITLLTHIDILIVKARFSADEAGAYGAASAFARVAFFVPATILAVLFPRTAARQARGEETEDILGRSLLATVAFCGALAIFYVATGVGLVSATFGRDFAEGGRVLPAFALAIGLYSVAQILVGYHLSRGETRYAWILAGSVLVQVVVLATIPSSLHAFVWTNVVVAAATLAAHEVAVGSSAPALRAGLRHLETVWIRVRTPVAEGAAALVATTIVVCALFWPIVRHLGSTIVGELGTDSTGTVAWFWQLQREGGYHLLGSAHHTLTGAPLGWTEPNGLNLQWLLPYYPGYLAARLFGAVVAFNLVTLSGYVLAGLTMYALVRYLGCGRLVAAWAGLVYVIFPWHIARAEHASLVHIEVLALLVLSLVAVFRRPTPTRFLFVGAANLACWLTSGYFGGMAVVATGAFALGAAFVSARRRVVLTIVTTALGIVAAGLVGLAAIVSGTNTSAGISRSAGDLSIFGVRPLELIVPPAGNLLVHHRLDAFWVRHAHGSNQTEIINYLGLLTVGLASAWVVLAWRRRKTLSRERALSPTAGLVATFVAGLLFAAPSPIVLLGHKITMPARLMWEVTPAFRVNSRWGPLLMTALLPLAALGLQAVATRLGRRSLVAAVGAVALAIVFSVAELMIHPAQHHFRTVPVPPEYAAVNETPRGILAEYPLGYSDVYRLWQTRHGRALVNGAPAGTTADTVRQMILDPAEPGTARQLALLGVSAIGIHPGAHVDAEVMPRAPADNPGYRLVGRFPDGASIWDVVAPPAPALVTLPGGFLPPARSNGFYGFPLVASGGVAAIELRAKVAATVRLTFDALPPNTAERTLRVADAHNQQTFPLNRRTHVAVDVAVPRGVSQLLLKIDPAPMSAADAVRVSPPQTETIAAAPKLTATPVSPNPGF